MTTLSVRDQKAIWHPFTQHKTAPLSIPIVRGEGAYLFDAEGKAYLDLISSWWVNIHGHANPMIAKAIYDQALCLEQVIFAGFTHKPAIVLAEKLLALLPEGFSKVFYSDNGSTSVEVALKMAYQYWRNQGENRHRFLAFSGGYHGDTFGAMSVGQSSKYYQAFSDLLFEVDFAPFPATWQNDALCLEKENEALQWIEEYLDQHAEETVAFILEPLIQGASGMRVCRVEFLQNLEKLLHRHGVLMIYDEVMTGFGRTGAFFACEKAKTQPDIICLSKGLTGGFLPLAATVCREEIYQAFLQEDIDHALMHSHSFTANPLGCASALASLTLLNNENTRLQQDQMIRMHQNMLDELESLKGIEKLRQCGTLAAFDVAVETPYGSKLSQKWRSLFMERGLLIRPIGKTIYFLPPYCISQKDLKRAYSDMIEILTNFILPSTVEDPV